MRLLSAALFILFAFAAAPASAEGGAICYSDKSAIASQAPKGWHADFKAAQTVGLCVVYVLDGHTFDSSPATMYPLLTPTEKRTATGAIDLDDFIAGDVDEWRNRQPKLAVVKQPPVKTEASISFTVRDFQNGPSPNEFERVCYATTEDAVLTAVLSARTAKNLEKYQPALNEFIRGLSQAPRGALFPVLKKLSKQDTASSAGAKYETSFIQAMGPSFANAMQQCTQPDDAGFAAVIEVQDDGTVHDITFEKPGRLATCLRAKLAGFHGPPPPSPVFRVLLELSIKP